MQRQLRLGDILDDYCPRERRLTNHAVVAMVGDEVKQTRCTTCDAEHVYKQGRVPRQRKKSEVASVAASAAGPLKRTVQEAPSADMVQPFEPAVPVSVAEAVDPAIVETSEPGLLGDNEREEEPGGVEEGPVHRPLIRAQLPRIEGQPPASRPAPDFTIRQPGGRPNRFRARHQQSVHGFNGNRGNGNVAGNPQRGGGARPQGGRPQIASRPNQRQGHGRKRTK